MVNPVRLVCVDGATVLWAHHFGVHIVGVGATSSSITVGVMGGWTLVAGVQGRHHGELVALV